MKKNVFCSIFALVIAAMMAFTLAPVSTKAAAINTPVSGMKLNTASNNGIELKDAVKSEQEALADGYYYYGDVNMNGQVNTGDAAMALQYASGNCTLDATNLILADANRDNSVNTGDASYILRLALDMEELEVIKIGTGDEPGEEDEDNGLEVTIKFYDAVNLVLAGMEKITVEETTIFNNDNVELPEGFGFLGEQSQTVTVTGEHAKPASIQFDVYTFEEIDGEEYICISTVDGIEAMRGNLALNFILMNDIDMTVRAPFVPLGWTADGEYIRYTSFTGVIEGNGHALINFNCDWWGLGAEYVGFVARNEGTIRNLGIASTVYTEGATTYGVFGDRNVGIICGANLEGGIIEGCSVYGSVGSSDTSLDEDGSAASSGAAGGITGMNCGEVICCNATAGIEGYYWLGGLVGKNFGTMDQCWFAGGINSETDGAFLFYNTVRNVGGLVGGTTGTITNCYVLALSNIHGSYCVGGLFGWVGGGVLENCYLSLVGGSIAGLEDYNLVCGMVAEEPEISEGFYNFTNGVLVIPETFDAEVWDMGAAVYTAMPDLVNNRRPDDFKF